MSKQMIYTSCRSGLGGTEGDQIYSYTEGISEEDLERMVMRSGYMRPDNMTDSPETDSFPVQFEYYELPSGKKCFDTGSYVYTDYTKIRYGSRMVHHITADSLDGYPIEYFGNPAFRTSLTDEEMDSEIPPEMLPPISMKLQPDRIISNDSIREFMDRCDSEFLLKIVYSLINNMGQDRQITIGLDDHRDSPFYVAAATMLFPIGIASRITFTTYVNDPGICPDNMVCSLNEGTRFDPYSENAVTDYTPVPENRDPIFDSYVNSAYSDDSDRKGFFGFLGDFSLNQLNGDIVTAFNAYYISAYGPASIDDAMIEKCIRFITGTPCNDPTVIGSFISKLIETGRYSKEYSSIIRPFADNMADETVRRSIMTAIMHFDLKSLDDINDHGRLRDVSDEFRDDILYAVSEDGCDLPCSPQIASLMLYYWAENGDRDLKEALKDYQGRLSDQDIPFVVSFIDSAPQAVITRLLTKQSPMCDRVRKKLFPLILDRSDSVDVALFMEMVEIASDDIGTVESMLDRFRDRFEYKECVNGIVQRYSGSNPELASAAQMHLMENLLKNNDYGGITEYITNNPSIDDTTIKTVIDKIENDMDLTKEPRYDLVNLLKTLVSGRRSGRMVDDGSRIRAMLFGTEMKSGISRDIVHLSDFDREELEGFYGWVVKGNKMLTRPDWIRRLMEADEGCTITDFLSMELRRNVSVKGSERLIAAIITACVTDADDRPYNDQFLGPLFNLKDKQKQMIRKNMVADGASMDTLMIFDSALFVPSEDDGCADDDHRDHRGPKEKKKKKKSGGFLGFLFRK